MSNSDYKTGRFANKYHVSKNDGTPIDDGVEYFVLRIDADPHAQVAALAYADSVEADNPAFALDIRERIAFIRA